MYDSLSTPNIYVDSSQLNDSVAFSSKIDNDEADALDIVVKLGSRNFERAKPFLRGELDWQCALWQHLEFYNNMMIPLHVESTAEPLEDRIARGQGIYGDGYQLLSDTEDDAEPPTPQESEVEDVKELSPNRPEVDSATQQYLASRIDSKRRAEAGPNYKERIRILGTSIPVPGHYFELKPEEPSTEVSYVVISVMDHEELDNNTNYQCLCNLRVNKETISQKVMWLPSDSPLLATHPQSALIKNYKIALKFTPVVPDGALSEEELNTIVRVGGFSLNDLQPHMRLYNAFIKVLRHQPSVESLIESDQDLMRILESADGFVTLSTSHSEKDKDLANIYGQLGVIKDKAKLHRRFIAGQLSVAVEVLVELFKEGGMKGTGKAGRTSRNIARTVLRDDELKKKMLADANRELAIDEQMQLNLKAALPKEGRERRTWSAETNHYTLYRLLGPNILLDRDLKITDVQSGLTTPIFRKFVETLAAMNAGMNWAADTKSHVYGCRVTFEIMYKYCSENDLTELDKANFFLRAETICTKLMGNMDRLSEIE